MPTLTQIFLDNFLDPSRRDGDSLQNSVNSHKETEVARTPNHIYVPALYVTPAPISISRSLSDPPSPSPYVVNHKGRGGGRFNQSRRVEAEEGEGRLNLNGENGGDEVAGDEVSAPEIGDNRVSVVEDDSGDPLCRSYESNQGEFFDADEVLSSDGSISNISSSYVQRIQLDLCAVKLSLLEEIERRKTAEHAISQIYNRWQRLATLMSEARLTFPAPPNDCTMQLEIDSLEQLCQEQIVTRFVADAIGRDLARAEGELYAEAILGSKDQEISRLQDRLQYCEAVISEMSQRNQENMQQQREKKKLRRWIWSFVGLSVTVGASLIAYSYFPEMSKHLSLPSPSDSSNV